MADVIIFGIQDFAELAHFYLENDSPHKVVAFSVNEKYMPEGGEFRGFRCYPSRKSRRNILRRGIVFRPHGP